jgi:hypothetical protein
MLSIDFFYYEDCPSHEQALERLRQVLDEEQVQADIRVTQVQTDEQAQALQFVGSPTIRIDGQDIDPPHAAAQYALTCRAYRWQDGRISPLPSPAMIRSALRAATAT